jgi:hypothetical protein
LFSIVFESGTNSHLSSQQFLAVSESAWANSWNSFASCSTVKPMSAGKLDLVALIGA